MSAWILSLNGSGSTASFGSLGSRYISEKFLIWPVSLLTFEGGIANVATLCIRCPATYANAIPIMAELQLLDGQDCFNSP